MTRRLVLLAAAAVATAVVVALVVRGGSPRGRWITPGSVPVADGFDFPVGAPDGDGYYDAQPFGTNQHLGGDWNGVLGGASDYGDPVTAIGDGRVTDATDYGGGWGNVVRVAHRVRERGGERMVESLYAHLATIAVTAGERVTRGQRIGTIGDAGGHYLPHLHLELRTAAGLPLGGGYGVPVGHIDPTGFIRDHRPDAGADRRADRRAGRP